MKGDKVLKVILVDDDSDDRMFFHDAIAEINANIQLQTARDGEELMELLLRQSTRLPEIIFLDLNMPGKSGLDCLTEIRNNKMLHEVFIAIYSTTNNHSEIEETFIRGANLFINKLNTYNGLLSALTKVFTMDFKNYFPRPEKDKYILAEK